jgi:hypothetical protein
MLAGPVGPKKKMEDEWESKRGDGQMVALWSQGNPG